MNRQIFQYPRRLRIVLFGMKVLVLLWLITIIVFMIIGLLFPSHTSVDFVFGLIAILLLLSLSIFHFYAFPKIESNGTGIWVEFLWYKLPVKWDEIVTVKRIPNQMYKAWLIETTQLTFFHRFYGLVFGLVFRPSFVVFEFIEESQYLINLLQGKQNDKRNFRA